MAVSTSCWSRTRPSFRSTPFDRLVAATSLRRSTCPGGPERVPVSKKERSLNCDHLAQYARMHAPKGAGEGTMTLMSERDVLAEGLRELAKELDAIKALIPEDLEEVSLRLEKARASIGLTLE